MDIISNSADKSKGELLRVRLQTVDRLTRETGHPAAALVRGSCTPTEFAEGSIASSQKQYTLKGGTVRSDSPQFRFHFTARLTDFKLVNPAVDALRTALLYAFLAHDRIQPIAAEISFHLSFSGMTCEAPGHSTSVEFVSPANHRRVASESTTRSPPAT